MTTKTKIEIRNELEKDIELYRECEESLNTIDKEIDRVNSSQFKKEHEDYLLNLEQQNEQWFERLCDKKSDICDKMTNEFFDDFLDLYVEELYE